MVSGLPIKVSNGSSLVTAYLKVSDGSTLSTPGGAQYSSAAPTFSNFGTETLTLAVFTDGTPTIKLGTYFYSAASVTWRCAGGRVLIPDNAALSGGTVQISAYRVVYSGGPAVDLTSAPLRTASATIPTRPGAGGAPIWVEVNWTPFDFLAVNVTGGELVMIAYQFSGALAGYYLHNSDGSANTQPRNTPNLYIGDAVLGGGRERSAYLIGASSAGTAVAWYGADILADDGP